MDIFIFFLICIFLTTLGKNLEIINYQYGPKKPQWLEYEYWNPIGLSLFDEPKLLARYDNATEKIRRLMDERHEH